MRKKRLFKYYILYLLIYIILYVQFNFNYDSLTGFLKSNILIFNKSILIQIEFFSFCIIMFLLINEYMSFYDNLKAMILVRYSKDYRYILFKELMIITILFSIPYFICCNRISDIILVIVKFMVFIILYILQRKINNHYVNTLTPLVYSLFSLLLNSI
jgi:membrane-associated phospholipid phosphatase